MVNWPPTWTYEAFFSWNHGHLHTRVPHCVVRAGELSGAQPQGHPGTAELTDTTGGTKSIPGSALEDRRLTAGPRDGEGGLAVSRWGYPLAALGSEDWCGGGRIRIYTEREKTYTERETYTEHVS